VGIGVLHCDPRTDQVAGSLPFETLANGEGHFRKFGLCLIFERRGRWLRNGRSP
jgi:hypothetical protein